MLTRAKIRSLTHASFYARGVELYERGMVKQFHVENGTAVDRITAKVQGSGSKQYSVQARYAFTSDDMEDVSCNCPAYMSYDGLCKHIVAVLLKYIDSVEKEEKTSLSSDPRNYRQMGLGDLAGNSKSKQNENTNLEADADFLPVDSEYLNQEDEKAYEYSQKRNREKNNGNKRKTTPSMKRLMDRQVAKQTAPLVRNDVFGKVRLEPELLVRDGELSVSFRIGTSLHMYVLKHVLAFEEHMREREEFSYGKKLAFIHTKEAFEPESRKMAEFLCHWARENDRGEYGYYVYYAINDRELALTEREFGEFLESTEGHEIAGNVYRLKTHKWKTAKEEVPRSLLLTGQEDGIVVKMNLPEHAVLGTETNYYFEDGKIYREEKAKVEEIREFVECMYEQQDRKVFIEKEDVPAFYRDILPVLEKYFKCTKKGLNDLVPETIPVRFEIYLDAPQQDMITCQVIAVYGDKRYNVYGDQETDRGSRDIVKEVMVSQAASSYCNAYDEKGKMMVVAGDEELLYRMLTEGIPFLQTQGEVFISDALKRIRVNDAPKVSVGISLSGDMLELTMTAGNMPRDELLEILNKYDRKKKYYRLKNGEFVNVAGEGLEVLAELKGSLALTNRQLQEETIEIPKYRAMLLDSRLKEEPQIVAVKDKAFKSMIRNMKTVEDNDFEIPQNLRPVLREYQKIGFLWLKTLKNNGFGGILADDMGLGKTLQVIAFLESEFEEREGNLRCLVVTPASLVYNWKSELERFAPKLPVQTVTGTAAEREEILKELPQRVILVTSYDLLKRDFEHYRKLSFVCQVIDEAQYIKNHNTQAAQAVRGIRAECKLALTGTPVENRLSELWSIFDYLMPGFLYSYTYFRQTIEAPVVQNQDEKAMQQLQKMIRPFVLRRLKTDVLKDLPDKLEEPVFAALEGEQQKLYDAHVQRIAMMLDKQTDEEFKTSKIQILAELTRLRQLCCDPALLYEGYEESSAKTQMCLDLIRNAVSGGHKILLFSQFTSMLDILCRRLKQDKISYLLLTGATSKEERQSLVKEFNEGSASVFCISLKAGGTGLNLTAADIVIHYDPWWNLAVQNQATDRAHRIGQRNVVTVYKLIAKGTIEENILHLQEKKKELADQILQGEGMGSGSFTKEELKEILGMHRE